jgi:cytochrome c oxidase subunit 2
MNKARREVCKGALTAVAALLCGGLASGAEKSQAKERVIKIQAKKFVYTPNRIVLKKDQPVILELTALDFTHGFNIPDMAIRADLPPGQITKIRLTPGNVGEFDFLCDNFCGTGHEEMNGKIIDEA